MIKKRLDQAVLEQFPHCSRTYVQSLIMQGKVSVNGIVETKAGTLVKPDAVIAVDFHEPQYVSRAGFKLAAALDHFSIDVYELIALDAGLSTGGFTDCLLQRGIAKVYGVDVGYGQVHEKIRRHPQVVVMERTNLRHLESLPELVDIVTLDLSFISVLKVIENVTRFLKPQGKLVVLIKPQFEAQKGQVGAGGIITNPAIHQQVIENVTAGIEKQGFVCKGVIPSPITGSEGNKEFLGYFVKQ